MGGGNLRAWRNHYKPWAVEMNRPAFDNHPVTTWQLVIDLVVENFGPNQRFDPFFIAIVRQVGAALGIPFEVLIMHFTASFSASRAAIEMAWQFVKEFRGWLVAGMLDPVWEAFMDEAVSLGRVAAPGYYQDPAICEAWLGVDWSGPGRPIVDMKKELEGYALAKEHAWRTDTEITTELTGGNWERKIKVRGREERARADAGLAPVKQAPGERRSPEEVDRDDSDDDTEDETGKQS